MSDGKSHPAPSEKPQPTTARHILVVEDNAIARKQLKVLLESAGEFVVGMAANGKEALRALAQAPYSIVITDLQMPELGGMDLLDHIKKEAIPVSVIVTTGFGGIADAVKAIKLGASDFLTKPIDIEHLRLVIQRALRERALVDELAALRQQLHERYSYHEILSKSPRMHAVLELINHVAPAASTVLVEGETGTGKELVARALHATSPRRDKPLVAVNCAAVPETLLESELFGHEKGAFTGAIAQRKGRFEMAHGGTVFLDEVGEIPLVMQAKLLRVLQERRFERVGGTNPVEVDVRVVAATNRSLTQLTKEGKFREDLYYRLNVVKIDLPPLKDRQEDIPMLAAHFAEKYSSPPKKISPETMQCLLRHPWPGNVRELENAIERACVTSLGDTIRPANLPPDVIRAEGKPGRRRIDLSRPLPDQLAEVVAAFERKYIRKALRRARGHIGRTATISGLSRRSISEKISLYKIDKGEFKCAST